MSAGAKGLQLNEPSFGELRRRRKEHSKWPLVKMRSMCVYMSVQCEQKPRNLTNFTSGHAIEQVFEKRTSSKKNITLGGTGIL